MATVQYPIATDITAMQTSTTNDGNFQIAFGGRRRYASTTALSVLDTGFDLLADAISPSAFYDVGHAFDVPKCHPNTSVAVLNRIKDWILEVRVQRPIWRGSTVQRVEESLRSQGRFQWCKTERGLLASFFFSFGLFDERYRSLTKQWNAIPVFSILHLILNPLSQ